MFKEEAMGAVASVEINSYSECPSLQPHLKWLYELLIVILDENVNLILYVHRFLVSMVQCIQFVSLNLRR